MTRRPGARWARTIEALEPGHRAWRFSAVAAVTTVVALLILKGSGLPAGSVALPLSAWLAVPPLIFAGGIGLTRARGANIQVTSASHVVTMSFLLVVPPDRLLLLVIGTELATGLLRRQPTIKLVFNVSASTMHASLMALTLHLLDHVATVLSGPGIFVVWASMLAGELQQLLHNERFMAWLEDRGRPVRVSQLWSVWRLANFAQEFVVACALVVTLEAVRASAVLWTVTPVMEGLLLAMALMVTYRHHHHLEVEWERKWLLQVRSAEALPHWPELVGTMMRLCRAEGVRLVVGGVDFSQGSFDEQLVLELDLLESPADSEVAFVRPRGVRRLRRHRCAAYRVMLAGGAPGDQLAVFSAWRPGRGLETRLDERTSALAQEITLALARERDRSELERTATHDGLTGLLRPAVFTNRLDETLTGWAGAAVVLIQVGRLRQINDLFGRGAGDELLRSVAGRLEATLSDGALTCRLGGHLFAAAVPCASRDAAASLGTLLSRVLLRGEAAGSAQAGLTLGIALAPDDGLAAADLIRRAELGLDVAYDAGEVVGFFEPAVETRANRKLALVTALREALAQDAITAVYQPQVSPHDGRIVGVEALARWTDRTLGFVPPDEFIVLAESSGLIQQLTRGILRSALLQCRAWADAGLDVPVSVNLSARSLSDAGTVPLVAELLAGTGVPAGKLTLEVTETSVMDDPTQAIDTLHALRELGCLVSLDDFGTGHSSLAYLRTLPADEVKLDRAFTADLHEPSAMALVTASVALAHALGLTIVAEGVEDQSTLDLLRGVGVDVAQGYHLCRPGTPEAIEAFLRRDSRPAVAA